MTGTVFERDHDTLLFKKNWDRSKLRCGEVGGVPYENPELVSSSDWARNLLRSGPGMPVRSAQPFLGDAEAKLASFYSGSKQTPWHLNKPKQNGVLGGRCGSMELNTPTKILALGRHSIFPSEIHVSPETVAS